MPGAPFTRTKAALELEIGFGDPEHLAASLFRLLGNVRDLSGQIRFVGKAAARNSGRQRDSLMGRKLP